LPLEDSNNSLKILRGLAERMHYTTIMAKKMELKSQKRMLQSPLKIPAPVRIYTHVRRFEVTTLKTTNLQFLERYRVGGDTKGSG